MARLTGRKQDLDPITDLFCRMLPLQVRLRLWSELTEDGWQRDDIREDLVQSMRHCLTKSGRCKEIGWNHFHYCRAHLDHVLV